MLCVDGTQIKPHGRAAFWHSLVSKNITSRKKTTTKRVSEK